MKELHVSCPDSIKALKEALAESQGKCFMVAGGTDLMVDVTKKLAGCEFMIDLSGVNELVFIGEKDNTLLIGSGTTFATIAADERIKRHARCLAQAASLVGSPQIRNRATIGGNVANCSPAADSIPALLALGAEMRVVDWSGKESLISVEEYLGHETGWLAKERAFIECFVIPIKEHGSKSCFARIGSRQTVTISKLSLALAFELDNSNKIKEPHISLGSVGRTAYRSAAAETMISGRAFGMDKIDALAKDLGALLSQEIESRLAGRATMPYKKQAVIGLAYDLFSLI